MTAAGWAKVAAFRPDLPQRVAKCRFGASALRQPSGPRHAVVQPIEVGIHLPLDGGLERSEQQAEPHFEHDVRCAHLHGSGDARAPEMHVVAIPVPCEVEAFLEVARNVLDERFRIGLRAVMRPIDSNRRHA